VTRDPIGDAGGLNNYEYSDNNSVNEFDPSGFYDGGQAGQYFLGFMGGLVNFAGSTGVAAVNAEATFQDPAILVDPGLSPLPPQLAAFYSHPVNFCGENFQDGDIFGQGLGFVGSSFTGAGEEEVAVDAENIIQKCEGGGCFVAGTYVHMAGGSWKRIEDVNAGDRVLSRNSQTGQTETEVVEHTFIFYKQATLVLKFADGNKIETTAVHPFYVMGTGFIPAGQLRAGDRIVTENNVAVRLTSARYTGQHKTVYNIEVADDHTYFVGKADGGLWVHNAWPCDEEIDLNAAANDLHDVLRESDPIAYRMRTSAVTAAQDEEGNIRYLASSSENSLTAAQEDLATSRGWTPVSGPGHAEATGMDQAEEMGLQPIAYGASRAICPGCVNWGNYLGAAPVGPLEMP
jgi:hypothetical protein